MKKQVGVRKKGRKEERKKGRKKERKKGRKKERRAVEDEIKKEKVSMYAFFTSLLTKT